MAKINWKHHFTEFLVVVLGILMAFQLNQCSTDKSQQKLVKSHVDYIKEETKINEANLNYQLKSSRENLKTLDSTIALILAEGDTKAINDLSFKALNVGYLYVRKNAYNSLVNSGDIRFINSFEKKKSIINMYEYYVWTQSMDEACRNGFLQGFFPYLKDNFNLVTGEIQDDNIYYSKKFLNIISTYRYALEAKIRKFEDCVKEIESFKTAIKNF